MQNSFCMPAGREEAARMVRAAKAPVPVTIAGPSCSGKSYFTEKLARLIEKEGIRAVIAQQDRFFKDYDDQSMPRDKHGRLVYDSPFAYHNEEYQAKVFQLLSGRDAYLPYYDISRNMRKSGKGELVKAGPVIIAEGLFAIGYLGKLLKTGINVYMDIGYDICLARRTIRDTELYGVSEREVEQLFRERVWPNYMEYGRKQKEMADIIIM